MVDLAPIPLSPHRHGRLVSRRQEEAVTYLVEENRVLRTQLASRRLKLTDDQRRRLAELGHRLGRERLQQVATIVTPDTILRRHRQLIARKWTYPRHRASRVGTWSPKTPTSGDPRFLRHQAARQ